MCGFTGRDEKDVNRTVLRKVFTVSLAKGKFARECPGRVKRQREKGGKVLLFMNCNRDSVEPEAKEGKDGSRIGPGSVQVSRARLWGWELQFF